MRNKETRAHTHSPTHTGILLGASINMRTSKERQTEKGFTQDTIFNHANRENYWGKILELCKCPLKALMLHFMTHTEKNMQIT